MTLAVLPSSTAAMTTIAIATDDCNSAEANDKMTPRRQDSPFAKR